MPSPPPNFSISFQNEVIIYEQNVICHVKDNEFNLSYNPTLLQSNSFDGCGVIGTTKLRKILNKNIYYKGYKYTNTKLNND